LFFAWVILIYALLHSAFFTLIGLPYFLFFEAPEESSAFFITTFGIVLVIGIFILYTFIGKSNVAVKLKESFKENVIAISIFFVMNVSLLWLVFFVMGMSNAESNSEYISVYFTIVKMFIAIPEILFLVIYLAVTIYKHLRPKNEIDGKPSNGHYIFWVILLGINFFFLSTLGEITFLFIDFSLEQLKHFVLFVVCPNAVIILVYWIIRSIIARKNR